MIKLKAVKDYQGYSTIGELASMSGEILNAAVLAFTLVLVGLGLGYLMLKLTPEERIYAGMMKVVSGEDPLNSLNLTFFKLNYC